MEATKAFDGIETIKIENPVDLIIRQLRYMISSGQLKPGDRLPAERVLAERFGVGRGYIREAILKLEFYGLLKTSPQSGTYVAGFGLKILDSIFTDVINFNKDDFASLIEGRYYLEVNAAKLAAERRTSMDIDLMQEALAEYDARMLSEQSAVEEDMLFHIRIAGATKNSVIESMILILIPDLIKNIVTKNICRNDNDQRIAEHHRLLDAIIRQDGHGAEEAMADHLKEIMEKRLSL